MLLTDQLKFRGTFTLIYAFDLIRDFQKINIRNLVYKTVHFFDLNIRSTIVTTSLSNNEI